MILSGCAGSRSKLTIACPNRPQMREVQTKDGQLDRENTKRVIDNHVDSWEYIHKLESIKGCK